MRNSLLLLTVLSLGCVQGPTGPAGPPGDAGSTIKRLVWVDATGAQVSDSGERVYVDQRGLIWDLDPETGRVVTPTAASSSRLVYASSDCSGPAYLPADLAPLPRVPFVVAADSTIRVRPDALVIEETPTSSTLQGGCVPHAVGNTRVVRLEATSPTPPVTVPTTGFAGPLHRELR